MDKENLFKFSHRFPCKFTAPPYSNESESNDEDIAILTQCFSQSTSIHQPIFTCKDKLVFFGSPEPTLGWSEQVALMKMRMGSTNKNQPRGSIAFANPRCSPWHISDGEEFLGQQQMYPNKGVSAWPQPQHKLCNGVVMKPVLKKECVGTGVFLPRGYCYNLPESRKQQAYSHANMPPRMIRSSYNKTSVPNTTPSHIQARINGGFIPHYEMLMGRRNEVILAPQRPVKTPMNNPEMLLPQEWTY